MTDPKDLVLNKFLTKKVLHLKKSYKIKPVQKPKYKP